VWLLAKAGYDPEGAVRLMDTVLRRGQFLTVDAAHGGWKTRARMIQAEIAAMRAAPDLDWSRHFRRSL
jgi:predicted Zn-dependent protease